MMNSLPELTEADVRARATDTSFERGYDYYTGGAVLELARRGDRILAEVEGSSYEPYHVSIILGDYGIVDADCTCPYDWGGDCKHIVAVLLTAINSPKEVKELPPVETMLTGLDRDQLCALILELVERQPSLVDVIETQISIMQAKTTEATSDSEARSSRERRMPLNSDTFRRQVRSALRSQDYRRYSEEYWYENSAVDQLEELLEKARAFIEASDGNNALIILEVITEECVSGLESIYDHDGEVGSFFEDLGRLWTEAVLLADLTSAERDELADRMDHWESMLGDYAVDGIFDAAQAATIQGWDYPPLQRVLKGEITSLGAWEEEAPWYADDLSVARLNVLARQGRTQEYLYLAEAEGQMELYLTMLTQLGRIQEAVDSGLEYIEHADEALTLAEALHDQDEIESALRVAEYGLKLQGSHGALARWIRDVAASADQPERALHAAIIAMREDPSLENYQAARKLAGGRWSELRGELLEHLRQIKSWYPEHQVSIFLYEGLIDDAITSLGDKSEHNYMLVEQVADAALSTRPDWVIRACRKQAETIMNSGKANAYHHAVNWLKKVRSAYLASDREVEWEEYLAGLLDQHKRKYKLIPMLETLM